ncbi:MAG: DUF5106 domain-containing protein [Bacteroidia bacterium]
MNIIKFVSKSALMLLVSGVFYTIQAQDVVKPVPGNRASSVKNAPQVSKPIVKPDFDPKMVGREKGEYAIKVKLRGYKNVQVFLADNFGDKQYFRDTCMLDKNGVGVFEGNPKLQRGMYMIVFPRMDGYYELPITDDQTFYFEADTTMDETTVKVTGSVENESFVDYQRTRAINGKLRYQLDLDMKKAKAEMNEGLLTELRIQKTVWMQKIFVLESYMSKNPDHLLTKLFHAFQAIKIPENPNPLDSMYQYRYFRDHYWDNIDFSESGLIRAPQGLITSKLNDYIDKVSYQDPDSLVKAVDIAIGKTVPYTEMQKYFVQYLTNKFQDRKVMCQDNITIHLINKYYCEGDAWWYDDTAGKKKMCEDARKALPTMCGKLAPDLNMADTAGNMHQLYKNLGRYTILFFYDPTCGHCKEVIPIVNQVFQKHKANGIKVYAVSTENQYDEWRKMMRKRPELSEWINVCKVDRYYPWPYHKQDYNIVANPTLFILDKDAKIIGKKIHESQLEFFIESLLYEDGIIKTKPTPPKDVKEPTGETIKSLDQ